MNKVIDKLTSKIGMKILPKVEYYAYKRYYNSPLVEKPNGELNDFLSMWEEAKELKYKTIDAFEKDKGYSIDKNWMDDLAYLTQVYIGMHDICYQHGRVVYATLRNYLQTTGSNNVNIFETGTARGFSSVCMGKAIQDAGAHGQVFTFDILPNDQPVYWNNYTDHTRGKISRATLLEDYNDIIENHVCFIQGDSRIQMNKVSVPRIHFAFLDGVHNYEFVTKEFAAIQPKQKKGDVIVYDDYSSEHFPGVVEAVDEICFKHKYSKEVISVNDQNNFVVSIKQ